MPSYQPSGRERVIFAALVIILLSFGIYRGIFIPLREQREVYDEEILTTEKKIRKNQQVVAKADQYSKKYLSVLENFKQKEPDEQVMSHMLSEIQSAAIDLEMNIVNMKPRRVRKVDSYNQFSVSLILEGDLLDILRLVHTLQNPPYLYDIEEFRLNRRSVREETLRCQLVFSQVLIP